MQFYFEFSEHEYYALVAVETEPNTNASKKAAEIYADIVGGNSVKEVLDEAHPIQVTKEYAFMTFMKSPSFENQTIKSKAEEFESMKNAVLLIDGALI